VPAYHDGPVPEVIEEGATGFIADGRAHPTLSLQRFSASRTG
jgi:hypothetical protein